MVLQLRKLCTNGLAQLTEKKCLTLVPECDGFSKICYYVNNHDTVYRGADKSLAQPTSRCILFDGENISFDASLVIYKVGQM